MSETKTSLVPSTTTTTHYFKVWSYKILSCQKKKPNKKKPTILFSYKMIPSAQFLPELRVKTFVTDVSSGPDLLNRVMRSIFLLKCFWLWRVILMWIEIYSCECNLAKHDTIIERISDLAQSWLCTSASCYIIQYRAK